MAVEDILLVRWGQMKKEVSLSTPCNGFCTMGALVLVYYFAIAGFHYIFYYRTPVFPAVGPPWS